MAGRIHNADVELVMFTDYDCAFCRQTEKVITAVRAAFGDRFAVIYRHYPVRNHMPEAYMKARIAECGAMVDRFLDLHSLLYEGDVNESDFVSSLIRTTGIESPAFVECAQDTLRVPAIEEDLALIREIGTRRTPSLFLDGRLLSTTPDSTQLHDLVQAAVASR
jgi:protein-disulfide isomerase